MAIITFSRATPFPTALFPTAALREQLVTHLPGYKWQCGENDRGSETDIARFHEHMLISGRSFEAIIFTELHAVDAVMPGAAPLHLWHLNVGAPTTEFAHIADRTTLVICMTLMIVDEQDSRCQLYPGGSWFTAQELSELLGHVIAGEPLSMAAGSAPPDVAADEAAHIALDASPAPPAMPARRAGGFGRKGL